MKNRSTTSRWAPVLMIGSLAALTIWGKLRFVSQTPRTAYADPAELDLVPADLSEPGEQVDMIRPEDIAVDQAEAFSDAASSR